MATWKGGEEFRVGVGMNQEVPLRGEVMGRVVVNCNVLWLVYDTTKITAVGVSLQQSTLLKYLNAN